jgi:NADPH-dependent F420 reductase
MSDTRPSIAVLGGTGDLGNGLAYQWAKAGYDVIIGSRGEEKAVKSAAELNQRLGLDTVRGLANADAAAAADIVTLTVPFATQEPILEAVKDAVQGKIFIDVTVPLMPPKVARVQMPPEGSAGMKAQKHLGDGVRVVSAFQNVAADHLASGHVDCDVLVTGNDAQAREKVIKLVEAAGMKGWHAGPIDNSVVAEALTSVLIHINKRYKIGGAGLRITGEPGP